MKIFKIKFLLATIIILAGCEKLVEIDSPQDYLISATIFESDETAISATTGLYATMMKIDFPIPYNIALFTGMYSDELDYSQTAAGLLTVYKYALISKDAPTNPFWNNGFNYIYQTNALIEGLNESSKVSEAVKRQLLGEAKFLRAFWNNYLINFYGPIPLIISTDYSTNAKLQRTSVDVIEEQILDDLFSAKQLLSEKYVASNTVTETNDRIRPNSFVASALLTRVYLRRKEYQKAADEATRIISNSKYDISELSLVFKRTSKEVIWQLELPTNATYNNSYEANLFTLTAKPSPVANGQSCTLSPNLLALFGSKDKRRTTWVGVFTDNTVTPVVRYIYPAKLKTKTTPADEYTTPFRLAEFYLARAEARAQLGLMVESINDTDKIRSRAGLDLLKDITPGISKQGLLDSINNERRREFFCEWGIRWIDIRRSPNSEELMKMIAARKGITWKSTSIIWPLPLNEILNSANNLKQNEGYN